MKFGPQPKWVGRVALGESVHDQEVFVRFRRRILPLGGLVAVLSTAIAMILAGGPAALAATTSTSLHDVLSQLRRNSKVSERLNAAFFRAPQTQGYSGAALNPTDSDTAFSVSTTDDALSLKPEHVTFNDTGTPVASRTAQTSGTFEVPIVLPNRAKVIKLQASYNDSTGNNTSPGGTQATSGFNFELLQYGLQGEASTELLAQTTGIRSTDGRKGTDTLSLANSGFQINNSTNRYVLRVTITDTNAATKFYGFTLQYQLGKGVPGAPA
jgi:hypothetical protein